METKKIAFACFIGGALCCAVALLFAPAFWWLGIFAGLAGGYLAYEFKEALRAIPIALRAAGKGCQSAWNGYVGVWKDVVAGTKKFLSEPHPFFYPAVVLAVSTFALGLFCFLAGNPIGQVGLILSLAILILGVGVFVDWTFVLTGLVFTLAFIGARFGKRCFWKPFVLNENAHARILCEMGYREKPLTPLNALRWMAIGLGVIFLFFVWTIWKYLAIGIWTALCFFFRFAWRFFKLIHSKERVLCAIDGTIGGLASYIWLASESMPFAGQAALIIFGGLLGAAIGIANYEIVSKRILRVAVV